MCAGVAAKAAKHRQRAIGAGRIDARAQQFDQDAARAAAEFERAATGLLQRALAQAQVAVPADVVERHALAHVGRVDVGDRVVGPAN